MNKQLLLTVLLAMTILLSVSAISASEVNVTDSYTTNLVDDTSDVSVLTETTTDSSVLSVSSDSNVDNDSSKVSLSSEEVLESENSNTLSTNLDDNNVSSDGEGATHFAAYSDEAKVGATIDVSKTITSKDITKYYRGSTQYTATFLDKNGNALKNTDVQLIINGKTYTIKTDSKGVASLAINLYPKTYEMTAVNPKTGYSLTTKIKVLSTIKSSDLTKVYSDSKKFTATFLDSEGKALANKDIKFTVNGRAYTQKTDSNGVASLAIGLYAGTYTMTSTNVDGLSSTNTIKVLGSTTTKLSATDYTFLTTDTKTIEVKLINGLGYALDSGKTVTFKVNGKTYTANTNSKGVASLKLPNLSAGTYTVTYSFAGDSRYGASSTTSKVSIVSNSSSKTPTLTVKSTTTFGRGANTPFEVALTVDGVPLSGKTVTFTINGRPYDKITDSNGIASLPIGLAVGTYTMYYANKADADVNSVSESVTITVKERAATKITWKSGTSFDEGSQTYKVLLQDSNGKALAGKTVQLTINSKTYSAKTSSSGYATFKVNVTAGSYTVSFSYPATGDNDNAPISGSKKITVSKNDTEVNKDIEGYGYWVFGSDMKSVNLNTLASQGTTDLFLNYYAINTFGQSAVESWIASANKLGIRVHIWMQTFYSSGWVNPVKNGAENSNLFKEKINEAKKYAAIKGVAGVHLDYLRYPGTAYKTAGGTEAINSFVKQVTEAIHGVNPNLIVSCALMPETTSNIYYYGQDFSVISKYMDVVIPMIYKGNYRQSTSWITSTTKWFVDNSQGAKIWSGLQGYVSDDNVAKLSTSEMTKDAQAALNGEGSGAIIFRWGVCNFIDFNSLSGSSSSTSNGITISDIATAANNLKNTIASKGSVPTSVSVAGSTYSTSQFLYMMTKAVEYIHAGKTSTKISPVQSNAPSNPSSTARNGDLSLSAYLDLASRVSSFIVNYGQAPNYANSDLGHIQYSSLVDAFSRVLAYYKTNSKLPNSVTVYAKVSASNVVSASPSEETTAKTISLNDIVSGATTLKSYYASNNKFPSTVTAGGVKFTVPEFLYLMSQAIYQLGSSNTNDIEYITGVSAASSPSGDAINANLNKDEYLTVSKTIADNIKSNKKAPNYASTSLGKIDYDALVDAFARVVAFYGSNDKELPNYVTIHAQAISSSSQVTPTESQASSSSSSTTAKTVSINDIVSGATTLKSYYASNNKFPSTVTAGGVKFTVPEFLYLMSQAIYQLGSSNTTDIAYITGVSAASSPSGDVINSNLYKDDYLNVSYNVANFIKANKIAPNYASSSLGNINYTELVDAFARVVAFYGSNDNMLPNYVAIKTSGSSSSSIGSTGSGLNEKCTITDLTAYLESSTNCQVNNSAIKSIVDSLTSGLTSDYDKAQAIFNYVRDTISYSFYYDTRYGAVGTLNAKTGNCVDHSHLLIAMYRTAGLAARYVQGTCTFSSGSTYGHVWTQVLIDGNWIVGDATSSRNSFGNVVNWNTNYYSLHGMYSGISF